MLKVFLGFLMGLVCDDFMKYMKSNEFHVTLEHIKHTFLKK